MISFFKQPNVNFMGMRKWAYLVSGVLFLGSLAVMLFMGLNWGIDFTGGTLIQIHTEKPVDISQVRSAAMSAGLNNAEVQNFGAPGEFIIKYRADLDPDDLVKALEQNLGTEIRMDRNEKVGPKVGKELREQAVIALSLGLLLMLVYIWIRFDFWFGLAAIIALFHDVVITMGFYTLFGQEITVATVAALLTILGYSINDSIVISDRIRENLKRQEDPQKLGFTKLFEIFNRAVNATLSRTIITSGTTLLVLLALLFLAGPVIFDFALALTMGVVVGTYSSIFVVAALVLDWRGRKRDQSKDKKAKAKG